MLMVLEAGLRRARLVTPGAPFIGGELATVSPIETPNTHSPPCTRAGCSARQARV